MQGKRKGLTLGNQSLRKTLQKGVKLGPSCQTKVSNRNDPKDVGGEGVINMGIVFFMQALKTRLSCPFSFDLIGSCGAPSLFMFQKEKATCQSSLPLTQSLVAFFPFRILSSLIKIVYFILNVTYASQYANEVVFCTKKLVIFPRLPNSERKPNERKKER